MAPTADSSVAELVGEAHGPFDVLDYADLFLPELRRRERGKPALDRFARRLLDQLSDEDFATLEIFWEQERDRRRLAPPDDIEAEAAWYRDWTPERLPRLPRMRGTRRLPGGRARTRATARPQAVAATAATTLI